MNLRFITPLRDVIGTNKSPWLILFFILVNMFIIISCSLQLQHFRVNTIDLNIFFQMINISCFERFKNCEAIHMGIIYKIHHQVVYIFKNKGKFNVAWHVYFNFQIYHLPEICPFRSFILSWNELNVVPVLVPSVDVLETVCPEKWHHLSR